MRDGVFVAFDGQSLNTRPRVATQSFPYKAMAGRGLPWSNVALDGHSYTALTSSAPTRVDLMATQYQPYTVLCLTGGTSDFMDDNDSAEQALADLTAYVDARRAGGWDIVLVATVPPSSFLTALQDTEREQFNTLLRNTTGLYDGLADLDADARLQDNTSGLWHSDGTHFNDAGSTVAADIWAALLDQHLPS